MYRRVTVERACSVGAAHLQKLNASVHPGAMPSTLHLLKSGRQKEASDMSEVRDSVVAAIVDFNDVGGCRKTTEDVFEIMATRIKSM